MAVGSTEKLYFNFVGGLNTEGSHLNNPENTADVLENFILKQNGSLVKRKGLSSNGEYIGTLPVGSSTPIINVHRWTSLVKGQKADFFVVQIASDLLILSVSGSVVTLIDSIDLYDHALPDTSVVGSRAITTASGKGYLFVASPEIFPFWVKYDSVSGLISTQTIDILIRDFYGKDDGLEITINPTVLSNEHQYNLFNQGWQQARIDTYLEKTGTYPSNVQVWYYGRVADNNSSNMLFRPQTLDMQVFGNTPAPKGHFVLNVLNGTLDASSSTNPYKTIVTSSDCLLETIYSNQLNYSKVKWSDNSAFQGTIVGDKIINKRGDGYEGIVVEVVEGAGQDYVIVESSVQLPPAYVVGIHEDLLTLRLVDFDASGEFSKFGEPTVPSVTAFYAGRVFYAGASSQFWSNAVFFSQLVEDLTRAGKCYQDADPTSEHISDLVATDGGVLFVDSAIQIVAMIPYASSLVIFASNGVWELSGASGNGFKATEFQLTKISDFGCAGKDSVIATGDGFLYWSASGIYALSREQISGSLQASSITQTTIQSWYSSLTLQQKEDARGLFDEVDKIVYWMYTDVPVDDYSAAKNSFNKVLVFDTKMPAFYFITFPWQTAYSYPRVVGMMETSSNNVIDITDTQVVVGIDTVIAGTDNVIVTDVSVAASPSVSSLLGFLVSSYDSFADEYLVYVHTLADSSYYDLDVLEYDAKIQTRYDLDGDALRKKQMRYIQTHFLKEVVAAPPDVN